MSSAMRRGGIPGPESRTGLTRPSMTEAEFERRLGTQAAAVEAAGLERARRRRAAAVELETSPADRVGRRPPGRGPRAVKPAKPRRVQRMFAIEEDLDKKLWLYAIHLGKDRSEVVNDLLRPIVASMVLYDSRDRRGGRSVEPAPTEASRRRSQAEWREPVPPVTDSEQGIGELGAPAAHFAVRRRGRAAVDRLGGWSRSSGPRGRPGRGARACSSSGPGRGSRP